MPKVFLSHSSLDRGFVEGELIPLLEAHGIATWYSRDDIQTADQWERRIREGLAACDWFLLVMSPRAAASTWVKAEVHWAVGKRWGRIVPVMLESCDPAGFHLWLEMLQHVDFSAGADRDGEARRRLLAIWGVVPGDAPAGAVAVTAAAEFVYCRLDAEHSPRGLSGFQMAYATPTLGADATAFLERAVSGYVAHGTERPGAPRIQFFTTPAGQYVVTHTVAVAGGPTGPRPSFLAHGLVLDATEFARAGHDPFALLDAFPAITSADELSRRLADGVKLGPVVLATAPPAGAASRVVDAGRSGPAGAGSGVLLAAAAERAAEMRAARERVVLRGSPAAVLSVLRSVFLLTGEGGRRHCTFDTLATTPAVEGRFWAVAGPGVAAAAEADVVVDVDAGRLVETRGKGGRGAAAATAPPPASGLPELRGNPTPAVVTAVPPAAAAAPSIGPRPRSRLHEFIGWLVNRHGAGRPTARHESGLPATSRGPALCPSCLALLRPPLAEHRCPACGVEVPPRYLDLHRQAGLLPVQMLGYPAHGKTMFLYALVGVLDGLSIAWPRFHWYPLTQYTLDFVRRRRAEGWGSEPPMAASATTPSRTEPLLMMIDGMERWGGRLLALRDAAGEHFHPLQYEVEELPFLLGARVIYLFVSHPDLASDPALAMDDLLNGYLQTLSRRSAVAPGQGDVRAVVVLTKGDQMPYLPQPLKDYLAGDPFRELRTHRAGAGPHIDAARYVGEMAGASNAIGDWIQTVPSGSRLVRLAAANGIPLRFCVISSLGPQLGPRGALSAPADPHRVLDPLFWGLELSSSPP